MNRPSLYPSRIILHACSTCKMPFMMKQHLRHAQWGGSSYCKSCRNERCKQNQKRPRLDVVWQCDICRKDFNPLRRQIQNAARKDRPTKARLCGHECLGVWTRRLYPKDTCYAPVPGGCPLPRALKKNRKAKDRFCEAHRKRYDRGTDITTHIKTRKDWSK